MIVEVCGDCGGTGFDCHDLRCIFCDGTGFIEDDYDEEDDEEDDEY